MCMCMYVYVYMYAYVCMYVYLIICVCMYVCIHEHITYMMQHFIGYILLYRLHIFVILDDMVYS